MKKGWEIKRLGDCCQIINGGTPKSAVAAYWGGPHCWITPAEMGGLASPYLGDSRRTLTDAGLKNSSARLLPPNSVILSSRAPIGHLVINTVPMATNQGCKGLVPSESLDATFLYYCLLGMVPQLDAMGTGATFKELSAGKLKEVCVPVPPLAEQRRIVAMLDEAFKGIAAAKANAEKNLLIAGEVFDSALSKAFSEKDLWQEITIGDLGEVFDGPHATPKTVDAGPVFLGIKNIERGRLDLSVTRHVNSRDFKEWTRRVEPQANDLVFSYETKLGAAAILPAGLVCCLGRRMGLLRFRNDDIVPQFVLYQYLSAPYQAYLSQYFVRGATVDRISIKDFPKYTIRVPSKAVQEAVVASLSEVRAESDQLEVSVSRKIAALDELKASLLHQAFTGAL